MGRSYGGYVVMAGLTHYPEQFAAGVNAYGIVNFETFFKNTESYLAAISKNEYGDPETEADMLRRLSPIHQVDQVTTPTLVLLVNSLKRRDIPVEYILFPDEGHGFNKTANRIQSVVSTVEWFTNYLK